MNAIIQHSVLIVSGTQKGAAYITELLSPREFAPMTTALSGGDARRLLLRRSYDLVVINTPLPDEFGHELAEYITEKFVSGVMVIAKAELFDQVNDKMEPFGILTVQKPLSRPLFYQALHLLIATQNRWQRFDRENQKLRTKMEEVRIVARAKCILVEYLRMSEQQAHRSFDIDCIQQKRVIISGKEERTLWATKHIWYSKTERSSAANPSARRAK